MNSLGSKRSLPVGGAAALLLSALASVSFADESQSGDPWSLLGQLRNQLATAPQTAEFLQTYRPAGFATGDEESGQIYLSLPDCVRWDYEEPYPKTFLLCQDTLHTWNPGEDAGRRFRLAEDEVPGIDLLRLRIDDLRRRYEAHVGESADGVIEVVLTPLHTGSTLVEARLTMSPSRQALTRLSYRDLEGNLSEFEITGYRPWVEESRFEPPPDLEWLDQ